MRNPRKYELRKGGKLTKNDDLCIESLDFA
jgi:hypothetical protein